MRTIKYLTLDDPKDLSNLLAAKIRFERKELFLQFVSQAFTLKAFSTFQMCT